MGSANLLEPPTGVGGTGIGMANVAERLKVLYGDTAHMGIDSRSGQGTLVQLKVPVLQSVEGALPTRLSAAAPAGNYELRSPSR